MKKFVYEIFEEVAKATSDDERVLILQNNNFGAVRDICQGSLDDRIIWLLPQDAAPPYVPNRPESFPSNLHKETVKLAYLAKGGKGDRMLPVKRESIFIGLLEAVHPQDALLLIDMINKKPPVGVTREVVERAYPGLLGAVKQEANT